MCLHSVEGLLYKSTKVATSKRLRHKIDVKPKCVCAYRFTLIYIEIFDGDKQMVSNCEHNVLTRHDNILD